VRLLALEEKRREVRKHFRLLHHSNKFGEGLRWGFEDRGCFVKVEDGSLLVGPRALVTDAERDCIREHGDELVAIVR